MDSLCDTCSRLIEYEPGDLVIQDADYCPRTAGEKLPATDGDPREACPRYVRRNDGRR